MQSRLKPSQRAAVSVIDLGMRQALMDLIPREGRVRGTLSDDAAPSFQLVDDGLQ